MSESAPSSVEERPEFRNIHAFKDLPGYRWPPDAVVSGMHRASGLMLFLLLPFIIWMFDTSISSEISFARFRSAFNVGMLGLPGLIWKMVVLALIWACLHHFLAGLRHLWMDASHAAVSKEFGRLSALVVISMSVGLTVVLGAKLFGLY